MACSSTITSASDDLQLINIVAGAHGTKYQKDLAMVIFERATRKKYDFRLDCEVTNADKFGDVRFLNKSKNEWIFIRTKHADTSEEMTPAVTFDMLFPKDEETRKKGEFSIFNFIKCFVTAQINIKEWKNMIIFTNRDLLVDNLEQAVEVEYKEVDEILRFENARHVGLKIKNHSVIKEILSYVNRELLKDNIVLVKESIISQMIKNCKTPAAPFFLRKTRSSVTFSEMCSVRVFEMLKSFNDAKDVQTTQLPVDKCKEHFTENYGNKTMIPFVNENTVHQFFQNFILFTRQPHDLCDIIDQDLRSWMRTWIRPDYFSRLEELQLKIRTVHLENYFDNRIVQVKESDNRSVKNIFFQLNHGNQYFDSIKNDLEIQLCYLPDDPSTFYINRKIEYTELSSVLPNCEGKSNSNCKKDTKAIIRDDELVSELYGKFRNQRFLLLTAERGMGKSTVLQFIALNAQQNSRDLIYLFNLNNLNQILLQTTEKDTSDKLISVLRAFLSEKSYRTLVNSMYGNNDKKKHFIIFDAFDEVFPHKREVVIKLFNDLLKVSNVRILVSGGRVVKTLLEDEFNVKSMSLMPFDSDDQMIFLEKFWNVSENCKNSLRKYIAHSFNAFFSNNNCQLLNTGLPLTLKMIAEIYTDRFQEYLMADQNDSDALMCQNMLSKINLYGQFLKKCFNYKMIKKFGNSYCESDEENYFLLEKFILEHQLLAIKSLQIEELRISLKNEKHFSILTSFEQRIINGTERSPLIEVVDQNIKFIHLSCAEFLVADFLFQNIARYESEVFGWDSKAQLLDKYPTIRFFLILMLEEQLQTEHIEIFLKHFEKNSRIAIWACEVPALETVKFLLRVCDSKVIYQLFGQAAHYNSFATCKYLLENHKVEVSYNIPSRIGATSLHLAAAGGHTDLVKFLISQSGIAHMKDYKGCIALHLASLYGHKDTVELLIDQSANVDTKNNEGCTPLHLASLYGHFGVAKLLIDHGADVNATNNEGETSLHYAAEKGYEAVVQLLIYHLAVIDLRDSEGQTPLDLADLFDRTDVIKILTKCSEPTN